MNPLLVSKREAARLLGIGVGSVNLLIEQKKLGTRKVGKRVLLLTEQVKSFARYGIGQVKRGRPRLEHPNPPDVPVRPTLGRVQ
jgi:excisionase family DNA binding protein